MEHYQNSDIIVEIVRGVTLCVIFIVDKAIRYGWMYKKTARSYSNEPVWTNAWGIEKILPFLVEGSERKESGLYTMTQIAARPENEKALLKVEDENY